LKRSGEVDEVRRIGRGQGKLKRSEEVEERSEEVEKVSSFVMY